jgi:hypothetical protein
MAAGLAQVDRTLLKTPALTSDDHHVSGELLTWERPRFEFGGDDPYLFFIAYGEFTAEPVRTSAEERIPGLPEGVEVRRISREDSNTLPFTDGAMAKILGQNDEELLEGARSAPESLVLRGPVRAAKAASLNYLRDTIALLAWWFDHGAQAVLDVQRLKLYDPGAWRSELVEPWPPRWTNHVVILASEERDDARWLHTRGLRKFGRPDLSLHEVSSERLPIAMTMFKQLIVWQAEGGLIQEGQWIQMAGLPGQLICYPAGSVEDPVFNNVHVEIQWPGTYSY